MTEKNMLIVIVVVVGFIISIIIGTTTSNLSIELEAKNKMIGEFVDVNNACHANLYNAETREQACEKSKDSWEEMYYKCVDEKMDMMNVWGDE